MAPPKQIGVTPVPTKSEVLGGDGLLGYIWSQWLTGLRNAVNLTPGNSTPFLFADLPTPIEGMFLVIADSTVNTWGTNITVGGGTFRVGAYFNGVHWTVAAV